MEEQKKAIFYSDIDGTLYGHDWTVSDQTQKSVHDFINNGHHFVIVTGNPAFSRQQELANKLKIRYLITSNGASIFDNQEKKYIFLSTISKKDQQIVIDVAKKFNLQLNYWNDKNYFTFNPKAQYKKSYDYSLLDPHNFVQQSDQTHDNIIKMELFGIQIDLEQAKDLLNQLDLKVIYMGTHIEITAKNIDKAKGIQWMNKNVFNVSDDNIACVGDSPNDWPMLETFKYSYAVANASKDTKSKAKFHTSTYYQNGVGEALEDYLYRHLDVKPKK